MNKNCIYDECKYISYDCIHDDYYCNKNKCYVPDNIDETGCKDYEQAKNCLTCYHSCSIVYETGTIDCIDYHCPFIAGADKKRGKMMYSNCNPYVTHHYDIEECNIGKWKYFESED